MRWRSPIALLLLLAAVEGCAANYGGMPAIAAEAAEPYRLGSGDEIRVTIFGLDGLTNTYAVGDAGAISVPLLNTITVQGRTVGEVETLLATQLRERDIAPRASVSVQVARYRPFYILGEVQKPGEIAFAPGMTILKAVSIAGGYTFRANTRRAIVTRAGENKRALATDLIRPGDTIVVPEAWF